MIGHYSKNSWYSFIDQHIAKWLRRGHKSFFLMGVLAALAWAPYHSIWGLWIGISTLIVRTWYAQDSKEVFWIGWWWGWGFYMATLFWVGNSLWVDARRFAWLWPVSVLGLPALFALYTGISCWIIKRIKLWAQATPLEYALSFSIVWSLGEKVQGYLFTGFPWNLVAYTWAETLSLAQTASWAGSYGLGLMTLVSYCIAGMGALGPVSKKAKYGALLFSIAELLCLHGAGSLRLYHTPLKNSPYLMRLVQPCIGQKQKGDPNYALIHFKKLVDLSRFPIPTSLTSALNSSSDHKMNSDNQSLPPQITIWPEGALPWSMTPQTALSFPGILQALSPTPILLTGGSYYPSEDCVFNSLFVQLPNAPLQHIYAKKHLLPFGEYIPHRSFLSHFFPSHWLQKVTPGSRDFTRGTSCELTYVPHVPPFRTLICYEAIFPEEVCLPGGKRPQWLLNITNDGWFGHSPGPYQHFASARFRAIEQGVPLVRVANTGISAIVDPVGRIVHALPLYFQGVLDGFLPASLSPTFYARHGNTVWWIMVVALSGFLGLLWVQRKRKNPL